MNDIAKYSDFLVAKKAERGRITRMLSETKEARQKALHGEDVATGARDIVNDVIVATQSQVRTYVEEVVSLALASVYGDDYAFELDYSVKRNQSEACPWILRDGDKFSPREEVGGGILDIAALALRLALWSLRQPRSAPVIILDEPGRFLGRDKQADFGRMLKEISKMMGIQMVVVSHTDAIVECADRAYQVEQSRGVSSVEEISVD